MNFTGANLSKLDLRYVNFKYAILKNANVSGANLSYCNFERADMSRAVLDVSTINLLINFCTKPKYIYHGCKWHCIKAPDKVHIFSIMPISSPNPKVENLLESSHRDDSNKWSSIEFREKITLIMSIKVNFTHSSGALIACFWNILFSFLRYFA